MPTELATLDTRDETQHPPTANGMPTTLATLLDRVLAETPTPTSHAAADAAIGSIGELGRALVILGQGRSPRATTRTIRQQVVLERLGSECQELARSWSPQDETLVDVTAAATDLVGIRAARLIEDERWALGVAFGAAAGELLEVVTRSSRHQDIAAVERVRRHATTLARLARFDRPRASSRAILDQPIGGLDPRAGTSFPEAAAGLLDAIDSDARSRTLGVHALLVVCRAGRAAAETAVTLAERISAGPSGRESGWRRIPEAWHVLEAAVIRFEDGSRWGHDYDLPTHRWAQRLHESAVQLVDRAQHPVRADEVSLARGAANQLPHLARHVENAIERWADEGRLIARARNLPRSGRHVDAVLRDRFVMATPVDVAPVLVAAQVTRRLSATLATELHRSAGRVGVQPHPRLAAALVDEAAGRRTARDAAYAARLADRYREIGRSGGT